MVAQSELRLDGVFYAGLETRLQQIGAEISAAELHGTLVGLTCVGWNPADIDHWQGVFSGTGTTERLEQDVLTGLMTLIRTSLDQRNFEFQLLLPAENEIMERRTRALAEWCQGCMLGLRFNNRLDPAGLGDDVAEFLSDLGHIGTAETGDELGETLERALFELEEYVRMGVQVIFEENIPDQQ